MSTRRSAKVSRGRRSGLVMRGRVGLSTKLAPERVGAPDQPQFVRPGAALDLLLPGYGRGHGGVPLVVHELQDVVPVGEAPGLEPLAMDPQTVAQVGGDARIEDAMSLAREDVDRGSHAGDCPR